MNKPTQQVTFSHKDVVRALIKEAGIKEGIWALGVKFGMVAANVQGQAGSNEAFPAAIIPIQSIGLAKVQKEDSLSLDAATVWGSEKKGK